MVCPGGMNQLLSADVGADAANGRSHSVALSVAVAVLAVPGARRGRAWPAAGFRRVNRPSTGLDQPTAFRFLPDGGLLVAEKSGLIEHFDGLGDPNAATSSMICRPRSTTIWDRGLLGSPRPRLRRQPQIYILYTRDAGLGGTPPLWGTGTSYDDCPVRPTHAAPPRQDRRPTAVIATGRLER